MTDGDVLALTIWGEARSEPVEGQIAVANVIRNRKESGKWGATYAAVCRARKQFSCWNPGNDANHQALMAYVGQIEAGEPFKDVWLRQAQWIAAAVIAGALLDNTKGATHYHALALDPLPAWAVGHTGKRIGNQLYYQGIA